MQGVQGEGYEVCAEQNGGVPGCQGFGCFLDMVLVIDCIEKIRVRTYLGHFGRSIRIDRREECRWSDRVGRLVVRAGCRSCAVGLDIEG